MEISKSFFVDPEYRPALTARGLASIDAVFAFDAGRSLAKDNLAPHRTRWQFDIDSPQTTLFLKRYDSPPILSQLANWISHRRRASSSRSEVASAQQLSQSGISTPKIIAHGEQWSALFEKRSFIVTEKVPDAESLERKLPSCFNTPPTAQNLHARRDFIRSLAAFIKRFHNTGFRHRDLYLAHIFHSSDAGFCLIDLARCFRPALFGERFRVKDIAQLYYSAPARHFSKADRLRFYLAYAAVDKLAPKDRAFIRKVLNKTARMARHNRKHGRPVPFAT
ncbi:MAG TPA: lipopolysaccharide kinase InaA family protein [Sedimentisphaerales bacterium]|nr:lipopolysaccharide kinase InaA family protein [Sedimentisphaerales bacterium]